MSLKVKCDNTADGCQWIGELRSLEKHLTNCNFALLPCPNQCKDGDKLLTLTRKDIDNHKKVCPRRQYECSYCKERGEYQERTTTHLEECPNMKIPCPNKGCAVGMERCKISQHRKECLFELVFCKFSIIGCTEKVPRKNLENHQNDGQQHLHLAIDTVYEQQKTIKMLEEKIVQLQPTPLLFRLTDFDKRKTSTENFRSPAFYTRPRGYKMCIGVIACGEGDGEDTHVSVFAHLMRGENDDHLPWPFTGKVTIELLNQLKDNHHHSMQVKFPSDNEASQRVVNKEVTLVGYGYGSFISHSELGYDAAKCCQYLKDDCLYFRVKADTTNTFKPWLH